MWAQHIQKPGLRYTLQHRHTLYSGPNQNSRSKQQWNLINLDPNSVLQKFNAGGFDWNPKERETSLKCFLTYQLSLQQKSYRWSPPLYLLTADLCRMVPCLGCWYPPSWLSSCSQKQEVVSQKNLRRELSSWVLSMEELGVRNKKKD